MPIEIKELNIRAVVEPEKRETTAEPRLEALQATIIRECIEQVLRILRDQKEP